jgi:hypothetical protein
VFVERQRASRRVGVHVQRGNIAAVSVDRGQCAAEQRGRDAATAGRLGHADAGDVALAVAGCVAESVVLSRDTPGPADYRDADRIAIRANPLSAGWAWEDLNLRPLPYQVFFRPQMTMALLQSTHRFFAVMDLYLLCVAVVSGTVRARSKAVSLLAGFAPPRSEARQVYDVLLIRCL